MTQIAAQVRFFTDGREIHEGTVTVDTEDTGTPWLNLVAGVVDEGTEARRKSKEAQV